MPATPTQTLDLVIEVAIVVLAVMGYLAFKRKSYFWHGQLMTIGFFMIIVSFILVMVPSLWMNYMTFTNPKSPVFDVASIVHIPFGILGLGLGGFLVAKWAKNGYKLAGMKSTLAMRATIVSWIANVALGAIIYFTMPS